MYNFSSEGAFPYKPIALIGPDPNFVVVDKLQEASQNIRMQILLEKLAWVSDCTDMKGCPKCSQKQTESCEGISPAYLDHLSPKLWRDSRLDLMG